MPGWCLHKSHSQNVQCRHTAVAIITANMIRFTMYLSNRVSR